MSEQNITYLTDVSLLTCVVQSGLGNTVFKAARDVGARAGAISHRARASSTSCLGLAVLADARTQFGELPEPTLVRRVDVVVADADADDLYDYIFEQAQIGRPQGGAIWMGALTLASPFGLPEDVPVE